MHHAKTFFWILAFVSMTGMSYAQDGWVLQTTPLGSTGLGKIQFVSSTEGWISADSGRLLHTTNAGTDWTEVRPFPSDTVSFLSDPAITMWWVNQTHGWKMNFLGTGTNDAHGAVIHKTTDGGGTWEKKVISTATGDIGLQVQFVDENNGWASIFNFSIGYSLLMHSTDGGNNWILINTDIVGTFYFVDANNGWMISGSSISMKSSPPYYIRHTTNGGLDWSVQYIDNTAGGFKCLQFADLNNGWAVGDSAKILKTTDGGSNWTPITNTGISSDSKLKGLFFLDADTGWIGCKFANISGDYGIILYTNNGGSSWTTQSLPVSNDARPYSIFFSDANNGWYTSESYMIGHTTNGGVTGVGESNNSIPSGYSLSQNYPNPFNPSTAITYQLLTFGYVSLKVYDLLGREITTLVNEKKSAGLYSVTFNASEIPSGVYFYRLQAGNFTETKKLVLLR
jgi:photosystem II stability/assembly factor-like uncharacterized protein